MSRTPQTSLRLPPELRAKLQALAKAEHRTLTEQVIHLIELALTAKEQGT